MDQQHSVQRVGVYGGTFNPIHDGHIGCIHTVIEKMQLDELLVIPASQSPHRALVDGPSPQQRLTMVQLGVKGQDKVTVDDREIRRGGLSYTIDTLTELVKPTKEVFLIIGLDQFEVFDEWKDFDRILDMVHLVVTSRPGCHWPSDVLDLPQGVGAFVESFDPKEIQLSSGKKIFFLQLDDIDVTSTEIRKGLRMGGIAEQQIPVAVKDFIISEGLYEPITGKIGDFEAFTKFCANILIDKRGINVQAKDLSQLSQPSEYVLIASGTSTRHATALSEYLTREVKKRYGVYPQSAEGQSEGRWVVLDYGSLIVHLFYDFTRAEYRLEELWKEGIEIELPQPNPEPER